MQTSTRRHCWLDFFLLRGYVVLVVHKLSEVDEAKSLMREAMEWSVFKWLFEKNKVRETADRANAALDRANRTVKMQWTNQVKAAYKEAAKPGSRRDGHASPPTDSDVALLLRKMKEADSAAHRARREAEDTFNQAERQMSTDLAREGCRKAIRQWELDEKAIRCAEAVRDSTGLAG